MRGETKLERKQRERAARQAMAIEKILRCQTPRGYLAEAIRYLKSAKMVTTQSRLAYGEVAAEEVWKTLDGIIETIEAAMTVYDEEVG